MTVAGPTLSKGFILDGKRARLMETTARVVCQRGIDGTKVSMLVREAGVSRRTFYEIFTGKDDCLRQTLFWVGESAHRAIVEAGGERAIGRAAHVRHALAALLDFVSEQPDLACFYVLLGPSISLPIFYEVQTYFAELLEPLGMEQTTRAMVVGGITESLHRHFLNGSSSDDPRLQLKDHVDFVLLGTGAMG